MGGLCGSVLDAATKKRIEARKGKKAKLTVYAIPAGWVEIRTPLAPAHNRLPPDIIRTSPDKEQVLKYTPTSGSLSTFTLLIFRISLE